MEQPGGAYAGSYSANSPYVWSASVKDALEQALMWIISIMTRATTTSAIWLACVTAATHERLGKIIAAKNHQNEMLPNRALSLTHASALGNHENGK